MRYTTIIDVTEFPDIWRNPNAVRLYFFMAMKCGYHDNDRDVLKISIRNLAFMAGLTLSACRFALKMLHNNGLISRNNDAWVVKKFLMDQTITPRSSNKKTQASTSRALEQLQLDKKLEQERRARNGELQQDPAAFIKQYEDYMNEPSTALRKAFLTRWKSKYQELTKRDERT